MALDEGALQHQRLKFRPRHDDVKMVDLGHHTASLGRVGGRILKVLAHAVAQLLGLAHVDHRIGLILHEIDPRLQGQRVGFFLELLKSHSICFHTKNCLKNSRF